MRVGMRIAATAAVLLAVTGGAALTALPAVAVQSSERVREIERILIEDDLDEADNLSPAEVVERMSAIQRGGAPDDFWEAYQLHLQAWSAYAEAGANLMAMAESGASMAELTNAREQVEEAERLVDTSFTAVEEIAVRYGARLPSHSIPINPNSVA